MSRFGHVVLLPEARTSGAQTKYVQISIVRVERAKSFTGQDGFNLRITKLTYFSAL